MGRHRDRVGALCGVVVGSVPRPPPARGGVPQRVAVDGVGVVLYRHDGRLIAVGEHCPHLGAPMTDGWIDRGPIVCPWHGSRFACGSGAVLRGPATAPLPSYPVRIRDGLVEVHGWRNERIRGAFRASQGRSYAHASEEERDLCPAPTDLDDSLLEALGNRMIERIARLRRSPVNKFRVRSRKALLSRLRT
ncbi:Rieske (2Fe-2S) protein [Mycobacterium colombiense]|uniref:Rieske (2Fe-2S) protein n=1 Tax=Mycobacterium colombiense TaxID=339268 RepID=UPI003AF8DE2A